ncbi:hypothetical protein TIFTF001_028193 [Ficus carica]|uniref:Uncharacterized protein n=1 Tax=Ficus carica TaxID=3494 RepID=A0AA88DPK0_FICCA|nr:hypothetical protein TIFTF001_028193 [Ficus carica]
MKTGQISALYPTTTAHRRTWQSSSPEVTIVGLAFSGNRDDQLTVKLWLFPRRSPAPRSVPDGSAIAGEGGVDHDPGGNERWGWVAAGRGGGGAVELGNHLEHSRSITSGKSPVKIRHHRRLQERATTSPSRTRRSPSPFLPHPSPPVTHPSL